VSGLFGHSSRGSTGALVEVLVVLSILRHLHNG
jgi:hypothetical protein